MPLCAEIWKETFRQLQAFKFVRDTGKVIPGRWEPGGEGINPWDVMRNHGQQKN